MLVLLIVMLFSNTICAKQNDAQKARAQNLSAITVYMDISGFSRKNKAAQKLTKLHQMYAKEGYELISVEIYTENADLQGFFVSYKRH
jgi:D-alanyl-D-alanine dipeptidase